MKHKLSGHWIKSVAPALCAGILGSVVTLGIANSLTPQAWPWDGVSNNSSGQAAQQTLSYSEEPLLAVEPDDSLTIPLKSSAELQRALDDATAERMQLAGIIAQLTQKLETIESDFINAQSRQQISEADSENTQGSGNRRGGSASRSRTDILVSAGVDIDTAELIQSRQSQYQLQRLELYDLAEREGWEDSDRFNEELSALNEQRPNLREELGDSGYDRFLFESGRNNRVRIDSIIDGSAADLAGLQIGDLVVDYADSRIFSTRQLQNTTREGSRGESIIISVDRQGQRVFVEVPRGPLGVGLDAEQENPS